MLRLQETSIEYSNRTLAIAISPDGGIIARGGVDGVKMRNVDTNEDILILLPPDIEYECSQVSAMCWVPSLDESIQTLAYGNAMGWLLMVQRRYPKGDFRAISSILIDRDAEVIQIAAGIYNEQAFVAITTSKEVITVCMFKDYVNFDLVTAWSNAYWKDIIFPKRIVLDYDDLVIFEQDGFVSRWAHSGDYEGPHLSLRNPIKHAAIDTDNRRCAIDKAGKGVDLYAFDSAKLLQHFPLQYCKETCVKGVALMDESRAIVWASDSGRIYIFDCKSGRRLHWIKIGQDVMVEMITACDLKDGSVLIAAALTTMTGGKSRIMMWRWKPT
ncbi:hypothetical protein BJ912DRAFT_925750 [Pholiota molesta]|nr:hypothetical protein BJ912DRAFT_925750 [Pholiota molesta]